MKNLIFILVTFFCLNIFAQDKSCMNEIAQSEIADALSGKPGAGAKLCGEKDPCVCFDGIDFAAAKLVDGKLQVDTVKEAAKKARIKAEAEKELADAIAAKEGRAAAKSEVATLKSLLAKSNTTAAEKEQIQTLTARILLKVIANSTE